MKKINNSSNSERWFWSVFRNKVLFNEIFSSFKFNKLLSYKRLIQVDYIIDNFSNGIEIIRDKVKSGGYLTKKSLNIIYKLFKKESTENIQFYNQLFQNYPNYFSIADELLEFIITPNLLALRLFIKCFKIKNNELFEIITSKSVKTYGTLSTSYCGIKILNHLVEGHNFKMGESFGFNLFEDWVSHNNLKINQIIKLIKMVMNLMQQNSGVKGSDKNNSRNKKRNNINFIKKVEYDSIQSFLIEEMNKINNGLEIKSNKELLEEIESYQFSKLELSSQLFDTLNIINYININNHKNNNISNNLAIIEFINSINNLKLIIYKMVYLFYTLFKNEELYKNKSIKELENKLIFKINYNKINYSEFIKFLYTYLNNSQNDNSNNKNSIGYINSIMMYYFEILLKEFRSIHIIQTFVKLNNIELIQAIHSNENNKQLIESFYKDNLISRQIISSIISKEMLEFYYNNYKSVLIPEKDNQNWQYVNSIEVLEHYELLLNKSNNKFLIKSFIVFGQEGKDLMILELLYRAFRSKCSDGNKEISSIYQFSLDSFDFSSFSALFVDYINYNKQDILLSLFKLFKFKVISIPDYSFKNKIPVKILDWFVNNISTQEMKKLESFETDIRYSLPVSPVIAFTVDSKVPSVYNSNDCYKKTVFRISHSLILYLLMANDNYNAAVSTFSKDPRIYNFNKTDQAINSNPYLNNFIYHSFKFYFNLIDQYNNDNVVVIKHHTEFANIKKLISHYLEVSAEIGNQKIFKLLDVHQLTKINLEFLSPILLDPQKLLFEAIHSHSFSIVDILLNNKITFSKEEFKEQFNRFPIIQKLFLNKFK